MNIFKNIIVLIFLVILISCATSLRKIGENKYEVICDAKEGEECYEVASDICSGNYEIDKPEQYEYLSYKIVEGSDIAGHGRYFDPEIKEDLKFEFYCVDEKDVGVNEQEELGE